MRLNSEQQLAVDTIEGPVMVVAGAGTGKTQTIALRIANILKQTQVNPSNILCLTFTDSAAQNMRDRLLGIIGPEAHSVRISTFHAFCQSVIRAHPEYFLSFNTDSEPLDKVEQIRIIRQLIDKLPPDSPLKSPIDTYYYQNALISALESLKKENIPPSELHQLLKTAGEFITTAQSSYLALKSLRADKKKLSQVIDIIDRLITNPDLNQTYKTKISTLLKDKIDNAKEAKASFVGFYETVSGQYPKQLTLSHIYPLYQAAILAQHRFDFDDMILSVLDAFKNNPDLRSTYQEKFQYILVDEYQDTNASQNELVELLGGGESPNLFVVGDDDQSIFRFQGASVENIYSFYQKHHPRAIVLRNNYRSHHLILASSTSLIDRNQNRISRQIDNLDKTLVPTRTYDPDPINLYVAQGELEENYWVARQIKDLISSGVSPTEIAVLVRTNADAEELLSILSQLNIRYLKGYGTDILQVPAIIQLLDLLRLLANPTDSVLFSKVINFRFLRFPSLDLYHYFHHTPNAKLSPKFQRRLDKFQRRLARFQQDKLNYPADRLFNIAIRRFGYLRWVLKSGNIEHLKQLERLLAEFKSVRGGTIISFDEIVSRLNVYFEDNIPIVSPPILSEAPNCIHLLTVHKAKGLEFEHVFLLKSLSGRWENGRGSAKITLPLGVLRSEPLIPTYDLELEENRRLFYVALTRAKNQIYISYTAANPEGRQQPPTRFISEIDPELVETIKPDPLIEKSALQVQFSPKLSSLISPDLSGYLRHFFRYRYRLNITHLNSYHKCPLCFFFKTILKIPQSKTKPLAFGTSVHGALAYLFNWLNLNHQVIPLEKFISVFEDNLRREGLALPDFEQLLASGHQHLTDYYQHYLPEFGGSFLVEHDFRPYLARVGDIPITGKIDKIEIVSGKNINVVDFKTGNPDTKYKELSPNGDYFRQLVFYKILADHSPGFGYHVVSGTIDFIQKKSSGKFERRYYPITPASIIDMTKLIEQTYADITSLKFSPNLDCADKDHLHCLFEKYFQT